MSKQALDLPEDVEALKAYIDAQAKAHRAQLAQRDGQIAGLKEQIQLLRKRPNEYVLRTSAEGDRTCG